MNWLVIFGVLYAWAIGASLWLSNDVSKFLAAHPQMASHQDLEDFKALARRNMKMALLQIGVLGVGILTGIMAITRHGATGFLLVLATNGVLLIVGLRGSKLEKRARGLTVADAQLCDEYWRVGKAWVKKPLPDF